MKFVILQEKVETQTKAKATDSKFTLDTRGTLIWDFGSMFLLETVAGNYQWSCPVLGGDNSVTRFEGNYEKWITQRGVPFGR
jgi:hypothetical protein